MNLQQDQEKLNQIREQIDQIDQKLSSLLDQRLLLALSALAYKKQVLDQTREAEILSEKPSQYLKAIFQEIMNSTKKEQTKK